MKSLFHLATDLGHCRTGAFPVLGSCVLPRSRLLCARVRRQQRKEFRDLGELERRILDPGLPSWTRELSFCRHWQQDRYGGVQAHGKAALALLTSEIWDQTKTDLKARSDLDIYIYHDVIEVRVNSRFYFSFTVGHCVPLLDFSKARYGLVPVQGQHSVSALFSGFFCCCLQLAVLFLYNSSARATRQTGLEDKSELHEIFHF